MLAKDPIAVCLCFLPCYGLVAFTVVAELVRLDQQFWVIGPKGLTLPLDGWLELLFLHRMAMNHSQRVTGKDHYMQGELQTSAREMAAFRRFQRYLQQEQEAPSPRRQARRRRDEDEEEEDGEGRGQAGPPPSWDGQTAFEDYYIKAKLWLATTKARGKARGPLLLKSLSSTPFETFKHLAKDIGWLNDARGAERLLEEMNKPEFYGDDQQEHMLTALSRITYHMKRGKNESWREFFSRWDVALRRVHDHKISLPEEYEGFLMINGLQLTEMETKNMLNFTHGCIRPRSIKEWLRKNETKLSASELGADKKKTNTNYHTEIEAHALEEEGEPTESWNDPEIEELELYINDLLDPEETAEDDILEENEAAEILNTILQKKKTYTQSLKSKKEKELSRGYGFSKGGGKGKSFSWPRSGQYRVSGNMTIEEIKRRTRCRTAKKLVTGNVNAQIRLSQGNLMGRRPTKRTTWPRRTRRSLWGLWSPIMVRALRTR